MHRALFLSARVVSIRTWWLERLNQKRWEYNWRKALVSLNLSWVKSWSGLLPGCKRVPASVYNDGWWTDKLMASFPVQLWSSIIIPTDPVVGLCQSPWSTPTNAFPEHIPWLDYSPDKLTQTLIEVAKQQGTILKLDIFLEIFVLFGPIGCNCILCAQCSVSN